MGIADLFKAKPVAVVDNKQQNNNQNGNNDNNNQNDNVNNNNNNNNNNGNNNNKQQVDKNKPENMENPLDVYSKLFDTANKAEDLVAPSFKLPSDKITEVASKLDFTKGINPDVLAKAKSGDSEAMLELIHSVGRNAYSTSLEHLTSLTDSHLNSRSEFEGKRVNAGVKKQLTSSALSNAPNYSHPVVKAELNRIADQFSRSAEYADATPQEIADAAKKYLTDVHSAINPVDSNVDTKTGKAKTEEFDWSKYLNNDTSSSSE